MRGAASASAQTSSSWSPHIQPPSSQQPVPSNKVVETIHRPASATALLSSPDYSQTTSRIESAISSCAAAAAAATLAEPIVRTSLVAPTPGTSIPNGPTKREEETPQPQEIHDQSQSRKSEDLIQSATESCSTSSSRVSPSCQEENGPTHDGVLPSTSAAASIGDMTASTSISNPLKRMRFSIRIPAKAAHKLKRIATFQPNTLRRIGVNGVQIGSDEMIRMADGHPPPIVPIVPQPVAQPMPPPSHPQPSTSSIQPSPVSSSESVQENGQNHPEVVGPPVPHQRYPEPPHAHQIRLQQQQQQNAPNANNSPLLVNLLSNQPPAPSAPQQIAQVHQQPPHTPNQQQQIIPPQQHQHQMVAQREYPYGYPPQGMTMQQMAAMQQQQQQQQYQQAMLQQQQQQQSQQGYYAQQQQQVQRQQQQQQRAQMPYMGYPGGSGMVVQRMQSYPGAPPPQQQPPQQQQQQVQQQPQVSQQYRIGGPMSMPSTSEDAPPAKKKKKRPTKKEKEAAAAAEQQQQQQQHQMHPYYNQGVPNAGMVPNAASERMMHPMQNNMHMMGGGPQMAQQHGYPPNAYPPGAQYPPGYSQQQQQQQQQLWHQQQQQQRMAMYQQQQQQAQHQQQWQQQQQRLPVPYPQGTAQPQHPQAQEIAQQHRLSGEYSAPGSVAPQSANFTRSDSNASFGGSGSGSMHGPSTSMPNDLTAAEQQFVVCKNEPLADLGDLGDLDDIEPMNPSTSQHSNGSDRNDRIGASIESVVEMVARTGGSGDYGSIQRRASQSHIQVDEGISHEHNIRAQAFHGGGGQSSSNGMMRNGENGVRSEDDAQIAEFAKTVSEKDKKIKAAAAEHKAKQTRKARTKKVVIAPGISVPGMMAPPPPQHIIQQQQQVQQQIAPQPEVMNNYMPPPPPTTSQYLPPHPPSQQQPQQ